MGYQPTESTPWQPALASTAFEHTYRPHARCAAFEDRLNAKAHDLIEGMLVSFFSWVALLVLGLSIQLPGELILVLILASLLPAWLLMSVANLQPLGSPGKRKYDLRILTRDGQPASPLRRSLRWLLQAVPAYAWLWLSATAIMLEVVTGDSDRIFIELFTMLAMLAIGSCVANLILVSTVRRALHDLLSGTVVGHAVDALEKRKGFEVIPLSPEVTRAG